MVLTNYLTLIMNLLLFMYFLCHQQLSILLLLKQVYCFFIIYSLCTSHLRKIH